MTRPTLLLVSLALLPACGVTESCSQDKPQTYSAPAQEEVPPISQQELEQTLPKLTGWTSGPPRSEVKKYGAHEITSVTAGYERPIVPSAALSAVAPSSAAAPPSTAAPSSTAAPAASAAPSASAAPVSAPPQAPEPFMQTVTIAVVDGRYVPEVYAPFAVMAHYGGETREPHKRAINIAGNPGLEVWDPVEHKVTVALLVAGRFIVNLEGTGLTPADVQAWIAAIDVAKLASWGKPAPAANIP